MRSRVVLLLVLLLTCPTAMGDPPGEAGELGPYAVGYRSIRIERDDATAYWAWVFYPGATHAQDAALIDGDERFPVVSFGHGFLQPVQRYRYSLRFLASHGYLVIATNSNRGIAPDHAQYSRDMARCLSRLIELGRDDESWLAGRVDEDALALSGHSMGGGGAERAAAKIEVRALIPLAGAPLRGGAGDPPGRLGNPAELHIVGDDDRIVPPAASRVMFDRGNARRIFATVAGGSHCGFMDEVILGCDKGSIAHKEQLRITRSLMLSFLDLHLKGDEGRRDTLWAEHPLEASGVVSFERLGDGADADQ